MLWYKYKWQHFESGKEGEDEQEFLNSEDFLYHLNLWNCDDRWKYWATIVIGTYEPTLPASDNPVRQILREARNGE